MVSQPRITTAGYAAGMPVESDRAYKILFVVIHSILFLWFIGRD
jgi:hypothetical protein